jgi:hypothetical protein
MSVTPFTIPAATPPSLNPNSSEHPAIEYLAQLFGYDSFAGAEDDNIFLLRIHQTTREVRLSRLKSIQEASSVETIARLEKDQAEGFNIFTCMNPFPAGTTARKERLVQNVRNLFIESDGGDTLGLIDAAVAAGELPAPHTVLESSPGKYHVCWHVQGFGTLEAKAMLRALAQKFGGDPASTDLHRVLRLPGFRNLKYSDQPICRLIRFHPEVERYPRELFTIEIAPDLSGGAPIASDELALIAKFLEQNAEEANCVLSPRQDHGDSFKWIFECPWTSKHTSGSSAAAIILLDDGRLQFNCFHNHCANRGWSDIRNLWQERVGHQQTFGKPPAPPTIEVSAQDIAANVLDGEIDDNSEAAIPPFDPSVINGIYAKFVELVCRGTTLAPQFAYVIAKTIVGARMAGKVQFENFDAEPRYYTALIGETGSGKGEAWRRIHQILEPSGVVVDGCKIKIINSADSGVGIKDYFFEPPQDQCVLCYVDEVRDLGNKSKDTRNPGILDVMIQLKDSTSISRVLAKRDGGGTKTKNDARFCMVLCGQDGSVYMEALAGRTQLGLWDRLYPEFGVPVDTSIDLPSVDPTDARRLLAELNRLDYSGTMKMSTEAKNLLLEFWATQPREVRRKVRWRKNLQIDAFMSAFGRALKVVERGDMEIAIRIFNRQVRIRQICFTAEVPDKTGYFYGLIKNIHARMIRQLAASKLPAFVAKSRRDFETETHAYRDNQVHFFVKAWNLFEPVWLDKISIKMGNGQCYTKYLPKPKEE